MKPDKSVTSMQDGLAFDLKDFVDLTTMGRRWAARITEIEGGEPEFSSGAHEPEE
jgi:hypothetical protein